MLSWLISFATSEVLLSCKGGMDGCSAGLAVVLVGITSCVFFICHGWELFFCHTERSHVICPVVFWVWIRIWRMGVEIIHWYFELLNTYSESKHSSYFVIGTIFLSAVKTFCFILLTKQFIFHTISQMCFNMKYCFFFINKLISL